jgi:glycosyltransferase involved in cell wall biosynthesis
VQNGITNVLTIYNGIDEQEWECEKNRVIQLRNKLDLHHRKVVLIAGRLNANKGLDQTIKALKLVVARVPNVVLLTIGRKMSQAHPFFRDATKAGIDGYVKSTGWVSGQELVASFQNASVVVVPSLHMDPLPTVVLEAMACQRPIIGTCFGGTPEMVQDGITGYLINPFDTEQYAEKVIDVLQNESKVQVMGAAALKRVRCDFLLATQVKKYLKLFKEIQDNSSIVH